VTNKDEEDEEHGGWRIRRDRTSKSKSSMYARSLGLRFVLGGIRPFGHRMCMEERGMEN
jgi:hypothetical protein